MLKQTPFATISPSACISSLALLKLDGHSRLDPIMSSIERFQRWPLATQSFHSLSMPTLLMCQVLHDKPDSRIACVGKAAAQEAFN